MSADDRDLMTEYMARQDPRCLAELYQRHQAALVRFLRRRTGHTAVAEDLAQLTWVKVMDAASRGQYTPGEASFKSFLFALARNAFLDECTRKHVNKRRQTLTESQLELAVTEIGDQPCVESAAQHLQQRQLLRRALAGLPREQHEVLRWWCDGVSIAAMAARARAPRDTVLSRKKYALARMRQMLVSQDAALAF